jgi:hypothetical protein
MAHRPHAIARPLVGLLAAAALVVAGSGAIGAPAAAQTPGCRFVLGFADLRQTLGPDTVGECLEDEQHNPENGDGRQRTTKGEMVWRKASNTMAYTDGHRTWAQGPEGLQRRFNTERFAWEPDAAQFPRPGRPAAAGPRPAASPTPAAVALPLPSGGLPPDAAAPAAAPAAVPAAVPAGGGASASAEVAQAAPTATATATPTAAPTPTPNALRVRFRAKPDEVDSGNDARFEVETDAKKGTCVLLVTYRKSPQANYGAKDIDDDGRCEWKFTLAADTKRGRATAQVTVTADGRTATVEDSFDVKKGDTTLVGDIDIEIDPDELPDKVAVGEEFEVSIETNLKKRGTCSVAVAWPRIGQTAGENKTPDDRGRCAWKLTAPTTITKGGAATLTVTVQKNRRAVRTLTKEFDVKT